MGRGATFSRHLFSSCDSITGNHRKDRRGEQGFVSSLVSVSEAELFCWFGLRHRAAMADSNSQSPADGSTAKFDQVQGQVNEVKVILTDNIKKVLERGDRLDDLVRKTDDMQASADSFQKTSTRVARKYWWKNVKLMIIIGIIVLIIVILIILFATKVI
ncbi:unnamed protein product [Pleuronectes platessa]|uniref:V-SNARE coiled-coil homology domain-containing protein n=2 Tax=Pleuronectes platessa TaxID=8262 RepID=A0A9N7U7C5_PLEPL|nr:unnamed protein product [Pleuronectes platessa]